MATLKAWKLLTKLHCSPHRARHVIIGTAAKWATVTEHTWPWAIVDEAVQMRSDMLLRIAGRFDRALFVGDPGQLDPFSTVDIDRWIGLTWDPMQSAVAVLLRHNPTLPVYRLPVSWRLPSSAVPVVLSLHRIRRGHRAGGAAPVTVDHRVRDDAAGPDGGAGRRDRLGVPRTARAARGPHLRRGRAGMRQPGGTAPAARRGRAAGALAVRIGGFGGSNSHRYRASRPGRRSPVVLPSTYGCVIVDSAIRLQGREYDVTIVLHPLSGRRDATAFHLEAGCAC